MKKILSRVQRLHPVDDFVVMVYSTRKYAHEAYASTVKDVSPGCGMDGKSVLLVVHGMGDAAQGSTLRTSVSKLLEAMRLRMREKKQSGWKVAQ